MKPSTLAFILFALYALLGLCSCQQTGSAQKLQSHLASAQTGNTKQGEHIKSIKTHLDTADYKGSRAKKLLDEGVDR